MDSNHTYFSIAWRVSIYVIGITTLIAVLMLALNGYIYYTAELKRVDQTSSEVEESIVPVLAATMWEMHYPQVKLQLEGIRKFRHVSYVELLDDTDRFVVGQISNQDVITHDYPIVHGSIGVIGHLKIQFSLTSIRKTTLQDLWKIVVLVIAQMLIVAAAVILVFRFKISRHLFALAAYAKDLGTETLEKDFAFDRKKSDRFEDELDHLLYAMDHMRTNMIRQLEMRREMEGKLQRAQKMEMIGTLAGGIAHDLNNILSGVVSYPELILLDLPEDSPLRKPLLTIKASGEKATTIVQDLLTMARRGVSSTDVLNLNDICRELLNSPEYLKLSSHHTDVAVKTHFENDLMNFVGSGVHISKTLMNLVSNACEAMPTGGTVVISTANHYIDTKYNGFETIPEGEYVTLRVEDNGIGIPQQHLQKIFEPFYTRKTMGKSGTGLGMAVVWGTVKDHNGFVDLTSTEGYGTCFTLYIPSSRKKIDTVASTIRIDDLIGNGESVLIVDDVDEQRNIAESMLRKVGYNADAVASGEAALKYLQHKSVNLLILDMIMDPGMDGLETYAAVLKLHPGQKAIIASGFSESDRVKQAQRMGAGSYIKKPYTLEKVAIAVKKELEKTV